MDPASKRNFNTISPSARWILFLKAHTNIPFARQAFETIEYPDKFIPDFESKDISFWGRTWHFENRYYTIDQLLSDLSITNILELSSGFSFRGLEMTRNREVYYIDTDLPEMASRKKDLVAALQLPKTVSKGKLEVLPLNALDEEQFREVTGHFPDGPVVIVNEGLLVYLDTSEKRKLCSIIRRILQERGGYWITADIYLTLKDRGIELDVGDQMKKFFEEHRVEENRFPSFEWAEQFFREEGFAIDKKAKVDPGSLSSFPYLKKLARPEDQQKMKSMEKIHDTWRLKLAE